MRRPISINTESIGQPAWLLTFSDLITLLLTFFVLRYAVAAGEAIHSIDDTKGSDAIVSINPEEVIHNTPFQLLHDSEDDLSALLIDKIQENDSLLLSIDKSGFQSGTESLTFEGIIAVKSLARILTQKNLAASITGLSYTRGDDRGLHYSEWDLAGARTMAIYRQLVDAKVSPYALSMENKVIDNSEQQTMSDLVRIVIYKP